MAEAGYALILEAWDCGASYGTVYNILVEWITSYKDSIRSQEDVTRILERISVATGHQQQRMLVEDFLFRDTYAQIHTEFSNKIDPVAQG